MKNGARAAVLAVVLTAGAHPVGAQETLEQACSDIKDQVAYLLGAGDFVQQAGLKEGVDLLANAMMVRDATCGLVGDDPPASDPAVGRPNPARSDPPPIGPPAVVPPEASPPEPAADDGNPSTRRDACVLVTQAEVGAVMKQPVTANEGDPAGDPDAQGCEFNGQGTAFTDVIYFQGNADFFYNSFHATAEANGVEPVPGLGDRAFSYVGGNGPGVVVVKGDKLVTLEFSGIGSGAAEKSSLLSLAQQAVARVH